MLIWTINNIQFKTTFKTIEDSIAQSFGWSHRIIRVRDLSNTRTDGDILSEFERKIQRLIFGPKKNEGELKLGQMRIKKLIRRNTVL